MATKTIRVGVVGLSTQGWASWGLIPPMLQLPNSPYKIVAACTSTPKSPAEIEQMRSKWGQDLKVYSEPSEMAKADDIDLYVVSVKNPMHEKMLLPAFAGDIGKKKDVFIEWPVSGQLEVCSRLAESAKELGVRTMVGMQGRQSLVLKKLQEILNSGDGIGRIVSSTVIGCSPKEDLYWGPQVSEGSAYIVDASNYTHMLHVQIGHFLDPFLRILGPISTITSTQTVAFPEATVHDTSGGKTSKTVTVTAPDQVAFSGLTKDNVLFTFHYRAGLSLSEGRTNFLWLIDGTEGSIRLEGNGRAASFVNIMDPVLYVNGEKVDLPADPIPHGKIGRAWEEYAKGEEGDYAKFEDAIEVLKVINAVLESSKKGVTVKLD